MQENTFKFKLINYWRSIDKKIFFVLLFYFFWGFFSFSSTSSLAGERLSIIILFLEHLISFCFDNYDLFQ